MRFFFAKHWLTAKVYVKKCFSGLLSSGKENNFLHSEALTFTKWVNVLFCCCQATPTVTVTLTLTSLRKRKGDKKCGGVAITVAPRSLPIFPLVL